MQHCKCPPDFPVATTALMHGMWPAAGEQLSWATTVQHASPCALPEDTIGIAKSHGSWLAEVKEAMGKKLPRAEGNFDSLLQAVHAGVDKIDEDSRQIQERQGDAVSAARGHLDMGSYWAGCIDGKATAVGYLSHTLHDCGFPLYSEEEEED